MSTSVILKLSFEETLYIESILEMAIEGVTPQFKPKRLAVIKSAHKKIGEVLDQAHRDGLIDHNNRVVKNPLGD